MMDKGQRAKHGTWGGGFHVLCVDKVVGEMVAATVRVMFSHCYRVIISRNGYGSGSASLHSCGIVIHMWTCESESASDSDRERIVVRKAILQCFTCY